MSTTVQTDIGLTAQHPSTLVVFESGYQKDKAVAEMFQKGHELICPHFLQCFTWVTQGAALGGLVSQRSHSIKNNACVKVTPT